MNGQTTDPRLPVSKRLHRYDGLKAANFTYKLAWLFTDICITQR